MSSSKKSDYNTKITEVENKIPSITGWVTTAALNPKVIDSQTIPNKSNLIKKNWL